MSGINKVNENYSCNWIRSGDSGPLLLLAHGAGAPMDSDFMEHLAVRLADAGVRVWRFEFDYMARRRLGASRRPPPRVRVLLEEWRHVLRLASFGEEGVFIGGKSMGGRLASLLAAGAGDEAKGLPLSGCLCFGYPFHPPGKPDRWRTDHFSALTVPTWIAQGERDPFGKREHVCEHLARGADTNPALAIEWIPDGNHDLMPPKRGVATWESNLDQAARKAAKFMFNNTN